MQKVTCRLQLTKSNFQIILIIYVLIICLEISDIMESYFVSDSDSDAKTNRGWILDFFCTPIDLELIQSFSDTKTGCQIKVLYAN